MKVFGVQIGKPTIENAMSAFVAASEQLKEVVTHRSKENQRLVKEMSERQIEHDSNHEEITRAARIITKVEAFLED